MRTMEVVVKPEHLQKAIEWRDSPGTKSITEGCVMNRALREAFPQYPVDLAVEDASLNHTCSAYGYEEPNELGTAWRFDETGTNIIRDFDDRRYSHIHLPATVVLTVED